MGLIQKIKVSLDNRACRAYKEFLKTALTTAENYGKKKNKRGVYSLRNKCIKLAKASGETATAIWRSDAQGGYDYELKKIWDAYARGTVCNYGSGAMPSRLTNF